MTRYLIALDLDGTLLMSNGKISEATKNYLHALDAEGHLIVLASGRPIRAIHQYYEELGLTSPVVCYNGAYVVSPHDHQFHELAFAFPQVTIKKIYQEIAPYIENIMCETNTHIWLLQEDAILADFFWHDHMDIIYGPLDQTLTEDPMTMLIKTKNPSFNNLFFETVKKYPELCIRFWNGQYDKFSEIYYGHISKAASLQYIADYFNIPYHHTIAFGDAENDFEMLAFAGIGVAMKNAIPSLKEKADMIALDDNDHDGIVKTLKMILKHDKQD